MMQDTGMPNTKTNQTQAVPRLEKCKIADGTGKCRQTMEKLARPLGRALDTATVLRVFLRSAKGADARHHKSRDTPQPFRWPLDTATVLRVLLGRESA
jgi:hypothetical protein